MDDRKTKLHIDSKCLGKKTCHVFLIDMIYIPKFGDYHVQEPSFLILTKKDHLSVHVSI